MVNFSWHLPFFPSFSLSFLSLSLTLTHYARLKFSFLWNTRARGGNGFNSTFFVLFNHCLFVYLSLSLSTCHWNFHAFKAWRRKEELEFNSNSLYSSTTSNFSSLSTSVYWLMSYIVSFVYSTFSASLQSEVISILSLIIFSNSLLVVATKFSFTTTTLASHWLLPISK